MAKKKRDHATPAKVCPVPADLKSFPNLMDRVRLEFKHRMEGARSGAHAARRAAAKSGQKYRNKGKKGRKNK